MLRTVSNKVVVRYGGAWLAVRLVGVVNVVLLEKVFIVHRRALAGAVRRTGVLQLQQVVIAASGWMRPGRPTAGHDGEEGERTRSLG